MVLFPEIDRQLIDRGKLKVYVPSKEKTGIDTPCEIKKVILNAGASGSMGLPDKDKERIFLLLNGKSMIRCTGRRTCLFRKGDVFAPGRFSQDTRFHIRNLSNVEEVELVEILLSLPFVNNELDFFG